MHVERAFRKMLLTTVSNVGWTFATVIKHFFFVGRWNVIDQYLPITNALNRVTTSPQ